MPIVRLYEKFKPADLGPGVRLLRVLLAPFVDTAFGRRVEASSWAALLLSFVAIAIALSEVGGYHMTTAAVLSIAAYLAGYMIRLSLMTHSAKSGERDVNLRLPLRVHPAPLLVRARPLIHDVLVLPPDGLAHEDSTRRPGHGLR